MSLSQWPLMMPGPSLQYENDFIVLTDAVVGTQLLQLHVIAHSGGWGAL